MVDKRQRKFCVSKPPAVPKCLQTHMVILQNLLPFHVILDFQNYLGNISFKYLVLSSILIDDKSVPPIGRNFPERKTLSDPRLMRQLTVLRNRQQM